jgi:hypothetical protein
MPDREDKMTRRADGTYSVTLEGLTLMEATRLIANRMPVKPELVHYRDNTAATGHPDRLD